MAGGPAEDARQGLPAPRPCPPAGDPGPPPTEVRRPLAPPSRPLVAALLPPTHLPPLRGMQHGVLRSADSRQGRGWRVPGGGARGPSALVRTSASLGVAPKRASLAPLSPWRVWSAYCSGLCPRAAARMRSAGCSCAPAQDCRPVKVTVGVGGWRFGGGQRMNLVALLAWCRGPLGGAASPGPAGGVQGRSSLGRPPAFRGLRGGRGGRGGGVASQLPVVLLRSPGTFRRQLRWRWHEGLRPGLSYGR